MGIEIERKFLVSNDSWRQQADAGTVIRQGYLCDPVTASVRVRVCANRANLNIKSATKGVRRTEYQYDIPLRDAHHLLDDLCGGVSIHKTRYLVVHGKHTWEIDVFSGENQGLIIAEIELGSEDEEFEKPDWLGAEVSARATGCVLLGLPLTQI